MHQKVYQKLPFERQLPQTFHQVQTDALADLHLKAGDSLSILLLPHSSSPLEGTGWTIAAIATSPLVTEVQMHLVLVICAPNTWALELYEIYCSYCWIRKETSTCPSYALPSYHSTFSSLTGHQIKNIQDTADKVGEFANKIRAIQAWAIRLELFGRCGWEKGKFLDLGITLSWKLLHQLPWKACAKGLFSSERATT